MYHTQLRAKLLNAIRRGHTRKYPHLRKEDYGELLRQLDQGELPETILRRLREWNTEAKREGQQDGRAASKIDWNYYQ